MKTNFKFFKGTTPMSKFPVAVVCTGISDFNDWKRNIFGTNSTRDQIRTFTRDGTTYILVNRIEDAVGRRFSSIRVSANVNLDNPHIENLLLSLNQRLLR